MYNETIIEPTRVFKSKQRLPDYDFSVTRKNNNYSGYGDYNGGNKLTRGCPFYQRPRLGISNNSVKYNIVTNEVNDFRY